MTAVSGRDEAVAKERVVFLERKYVLLSESLQLQLGSLAFFMPGLSCRRVLAVRIENGRSPESTGNGARFWRAGGYDVVGFIDIHRKNVGEKIAGVEIVGSIDNVGKVIAERNVSEVIFSTDGLSYADILSVIARSNDRSVNFRLVPNSLESIIGKTRIDELDTLPLVEIEYNIHRPGNRFAKRIFDLIISTVCLILVYPWVRVLSSAKSQGRFVRFVRLLPDVFFGRMSLVGRPLSDIDTTPGDPRSAAYSLLGPKGLTGLVQINKRDDLQAEEVERYKLYYAKNQSLILDMEILLKSFLLAARK